MESLSLEWLSVPLHCTLGALGFLRIVNVDSGPLPFQRRAEAVWISSSTIEARLAVSEGGSRESWPRRSSCQWGQEVGQLPLCSQRDEETWGMSEGDVISVLLSPASLPALQRTVSSAFVFEVKASVVAKPAPVPLCFLNTSPQDTSEEAAVLSYLPPVLLKGNKVLLFEANCPGLDP